MKLDPDCIRDILLAVEDCDYGEHLNIESLHKLLPQYTDEQLEYTCLMLGDGGYLNITKVQLPMVLLPSVKSINSLTYQGHEFIANIRKESVWNGIKSVALKVGSTSLSSLVQISGNVVTELIKSQFGL